MNKFEQIWGRTRGYHIMGLNGTRSGRGGAGLGQNHQVGIGLGKDMDLRVPSQQV